MAADRELTLDLIDEDLPAAQRQAESLRLVLRRGDGDQATDFYIEHTYEDGERYLVRLRCDGYDGRAPSFQFVNPANVEETGPQWWPRIEGVGCARGDRGEVVYCTPGIREYHQHQSHRGESWDKKSWKLPRVVWLTWKYLVGSGRYLGRGGV